MVIIYTGLKFLTKKRTIRFSSGFLSILGGWGLKEMANIGCHEVEDGGRGVSYELSLPSLPGQGGAQLPEMKAFLALFSTEAAGRRVSPLGVVEVIPQEVMVR